MHASSRALRAFSVHRALRALPFLFVTALSCASAAAGDAPLDEVVVTADLRDRRLLDLPASASVLDASKLEIAGVQHLQDVIGLLPNLNWSAGTSRPRFFQIRGVGELSQWQGAPNPSVGFLIDDVDFSGIGMPANLADVERIEVLRGPQGTAYGANALAGLIAVSTRDARPETEFSADVTGGDYGTYGVNAVLGGPLGSGEGSSDAAWRLVAGDFRSDGFRRNRFLDRDDTNGYAESQVRLKLSARPTDRLRARFSAMVVDLDNGYDAFSIDNSRVTLSDKPGQDAQISRAWSLRLDYEARAFQVISRTSMGKSRSVYSFDGDWGNDISWGANSPYDYFQRFDREHDTLSQDLRFVSRENVDSGASFSWLAGLYALRTDEDVRQTDVWRDLQFGDGEAVFTSDYRATNLAAYGELEWRVGERTVLSAGARAERRNADYSDSDGARFAPGETMYGGSLTLRHELDDRRSLYARAARGYKAGGFNIGAALPENLLTFDAETLENLELGLRSASERGALDADVALFYMRRHDQQVPTGLQLVPGDPLTFVLYTDNAAGGENYGLEATLGWRPTASLLVDLRAALLQTRYLDYAIEDRNLDGREQAHAPQYQFDLGLELRRARYFARVDFAGVDDFYFDDSHDERAPSRVLTNLKAGVSGKHWRAEVWVRNLFDEYYSQRGFWFGNEPPDFTPKRYVQAGDPRHFGVTVTYHFR
jgi:outer membrane receptor protein involved in Fe transport